MSDAAGAVVSLPERISIDQAESLKNKMEKIREKYSSLVLDFRKVNEIDPAGIQLISSFALECVNNANEFGCLGPLKENIKENLLLSGILVSRENDEYLFPFLYSEGVKVELG